MTIVGRITAAIQRDEEVKTQGASRYKRKAHFLKNARK
jgi:hypothetical protein